MAVATLQTTIRSGYKQTEVGVIPKDWEVKRLGDIATFFSGGTPSTAMPSYYGGNIPWITSGDLNKGIIQDVDGRITPKGLENSSAKIVEQDTLLLALYGATAGVTAISEIKAAINQAVLAILPKSDSSLFLFFQLVYLKDRIVNTYIQGGQPNLSGDIVKSIELALPSPSEQHVIASALFDVDALLAALDQLTDKKRNIKTAAMQQLLTGKRRLPGFSGEWDLRRLGTLGSTYGGLTGKTKADFGDGSAWYIPFLNVLNNVVIDPTNFEAVRVSASERQNQVLKGDLFFNGSSETPEEVGMCSVLLNDVQNVFLNSFCFGFRFRDGAAVDGLYLAYFFRSGQGRELLYSLAQGATRYNLSKTSLLKLEFAIPGLDEQTAIAAILSDMDADIAALEARRDKARALKQGMMQQLLTGSIRLV